MLKFVPCAQTQKCPRRNKRGFAVLLCFLLFILSTHFQQLIYFIRLCQSYCWLFSVDSCTAVWTAVRQGICFEAVVAGIAVVKFQFIITSVLLWVCNVCGCWHSGTAVYRCAPSCVYCYVRGVSEVCQRYSLPPQHLIKSLQFQLWEIIASCPQCFCFINDEVFIEI